MKTLHTKCSKASGEIKSPGVQSDNKSGNKYGWNVIIDSKTHEGLEILGKHFDLSKKLIVRQLVSEKLRSLNLDNPIKEVAI